MRAIAENGVRAYCRVEQATGNSEEDPCVDSEGEAEAQTNVEQLCWVRALWNGCTLATGRGLGGVGHLGTCKSKEAVPPSQLIYFHDNASKFGAKVLME